MFRNLRVLSKPVALLRREVAELDFLFKVALSTRRLEATLGATGRRNQRRRDGDRRIVTFERRHYH